MNASPSRDVYTQVTDTIIAPIEAGAGQWDMPWHRHGVTHTRPMNALTGKRYRGVNVLALWAATEGPGLHHGSLGHLPPMTGKGRAGPQGREILPRRLLQGARGRRDQPGNRRD